MAIEQRTLGKTGVAVSAVGLGGEGVLRTRGRQAEAVALVRRALDLGITYFESARAYAGSEGYLGQALGSDRRSVFLATKSHARRDRGARAHLDESLALLRTDWLDLWFVHDVRTRQDLDILTGPGGALETFDKARRNGLARFVGVSGHQDPAILAEALDLFDFDCVLLPVNPAEACAGAFSDLVVPKARHRGLGVIAMKTLCRGLVTRIPGYPGTAPFLRYALGVQGVCVASVGCDDPGQLEENAAAAVRLAPLSDEEARALGKLVSPFARDLMYYRS
jgi:aryl-alcohol dehydrogenase-like predicted oxidoreductase